MSINSKVQIIITGKDGITKVVNISDLMSIQAEIGDKFQVVQTVNGETNLLDNFMIIKNKDTLEISFASGEILSIENFYSYNNVEMKFTVSDNSIYRLSSQNSFDQELADGTSFVYAHGSEHILQSMSNGNESLQSALSDQITVENSEIFALDTDIKDISTDEGIPLDNSNSSDSLGDLSQLADFTTIDKTINTATTITTLDLFNTNNIDLQTILNISIEDTETISLTGWQDIVANKINSSYPLSIPKFGNDSYTLVETVEDGTSIVI